MRRRVDQARGGAPEPGAGRRGSAWRRPGVAAVGVVVGVASLAGAHAVAAQSSQDAAEEVEVRAEPDRVETTVGERGALSVTLVPAAGLRIDARGPLRLDVSVAPDGDGFEIARARYARKHAADARAAAPRFDLRYRARTPGAYRVAVEARLWLCRKHSCWPGRARREIAVVVSAAAPDAPEAPNAPSGDGAGADAAGDRAADDIPGGATSIAR